MGQPAYQRDGDPLTSGPGFAYTEHEDRLKQPFRWAKPRMIFVNSMSDLFHEQASAAFVHRVFDVMRLCPEHTFQVLTKRPERMRELVTDYYRLTASANPGGGRVSYPLPNVWLGTSIENARFTWRADVLREVPAAVRFISAEPLLGSLFPADPLPDRPDPRLSADDDRRRRIEREQAVAGRNRAALDLTDIDWLIAGGESGPGYRPVNVEHLRELRDACQAAGVAFFFKQWGGVRPRSGGKVLDGREWCEMPVAAAA